MSNPENSPEIDRSTPEITAQIGERILELTYNNTVVVTYYHPYQDFRHLHVEEDDTIDLVYLSDELIDICLDNHYPTALMPFPSEKQYEDYMEAQRRSLESDLEGLNEPPRS